MPDRMRRVLHAFAALADLGEEIAETDDFEEMVRSALHIVLGALGIRRGVVAEFERDSSTLRVVATRGFGQKFPPSVSTILEVGYAAATPTNGSHRTASSRRELSHFEQEVKDHFGEKASAECFTEEDREIIRSFGRHIGIGLHNHRLLREVERRAVENLKLYEELKGIYKDTVRAFAAAIDCKDKYTQGHSERVGKYSEIIAREMGWS